MFAHTHGCFVEVFQKPRRVLGQRPESSPAGGETLSLGVSLVLSLRLRHQRKDGENFWLFISGRPENEGFDIYNLM